MNSHHISVREGTIEQAVGVHSTIAEFTKPADVEYFKDRYKEKTHLILVAYLEDNLAGYLIAYDKHQDGSIYYWMIGVNPDFRQKGILSKLTEAFESWSRKQKYRTIHVKTRKSREWMAHYLKKNGYIPQHPQIDEIPDDKDILLLQKNL